jgi:uncharacterized protein YecE (DUF72 family)
VNASRIFIGTAGWSIPRPSAHRVPLRGTHLERYSGLLRSVEINSSFHRSHMRATYEKWAAATPSHFRFAAKVPRAITHDQRLRGSRVLLESFLEETGGLGDKRGPLLVQLPPSLAIEPRAAQRFFTLLRSRYRGTVVCEPRHPTWFTREADAILVRYQVARVAADPSPAAGADVPGGWPGIVYIRLHGSPRTYWSRYPADYIAALADRLRLIPSSIDAWCVFDNTASGAALENALELQTALG